MNELLDFLINKISSVQMYQSFLKNKDCLFSATQCSNTRDFFVDLFTNENIKDCIYYKNDKIISIEIYSLFGSYMLSNKKFINIPDHTFIILKFMDEIYLLQSYYNAYNYSGAYGLRKMDKNSSTI